MREKEREERGGGKGERKRNRRKENGERQRVGVKVMKGAKSAITRKEKATENYRKLRNVRNDTTALY